MEKRPTYQAKSMRKLDYIVCIVDSAGRRIDQVRIDRPVTRAEALKHVQEALEHFKNDTLVYGAYATTL